MASSTTIGITTALELVRFAMTAKGLEGKTPEEVLEMWAATRTDVRRAIDAWRASKASSGS